MLLSCSLGTLDTVSFAHGRGSCCPLSTFPHMPACTSILGRQIPLAATEQSGFCWKRSDSAVGCWLLALTLLSLCRVGTGPKATLLCTFVRWDFDTIKFSE